MHPHDVRWVCLFDVFFLWYCFFPDIILVLLDTTFSLGWLLEGLARGFLLSRGVSTSCFPSIFSLEEAYFVFCFDWIDSRATTGFTS